MIIGINPIDLLKSVIFVGRWSVEILFILSVNWMRIHCMIYILFELWIVSTSFCYSITGSLNFFFKEKSQFFCIFVFCHCIVFIKFQCQPWYSIQKISFDWSQIFIKFCMQIQKFTRKNAIVYHSITEIHSMQCSKSLLFHLLFHFFFF